MRTNNIVKYATVVGGLAALLLASCQNDESSKQKRRLDKLNHYIQIGDYKGFNDEVTSEVKPLIDQVIEMMRVNGYCSQSTPGSNKNPLAGKPRYEEKCNSNSYGLPDLFGKTNVQYSRTKIPDEGESCEIRILDLEKSVSVDDNGANGLRMFEGDRYMGQEVTANKRAEASNQFTKANDGYKALLNKLISYKGISRGKKLNKM